MKQTKLFKIETIEKDRDQLQKAADILARGGLVAIPTETVYGLAANALDPEAAKAIYAAKGRPSDKMCIRDSQRRENRHPGGNHPWL